MSANMQMRCDKVLNASAVFVLEFGDRVEMKVKTTC